MVHNVCVGKRKRDELDSSFSSEETIPQIERSLSREALGAIVELSSENAKNSTAVWEKMEGIRPSTKLKFKETDLAFETGLKLIQHFYEHDPDFGKENICISIALCRVKNIVDNIEREEFLCSFSGSTHIDSELHAKKDKIIRLFPSAIQVILAEKSSQHLSNLLAQIIKNTTSDEDLKREYFECTSGGAAKCDLEKMKGSLSKKTCAEKFFFNHIGIRSPDKIYEIMEGMTFFVTPKVQNCQTYLNSAFELGSEYRTAAVLFRDKQGLYSLQKVSICEKPTIQITGDARAIIRAVNGCWSCSLQKKAYYTLACVGAELKQRASLRN